MRFYTKQHKFYCCIDLHARTMYLCILNQECKIVLHCDIKTDPDIFLKTIAPYREDIVVAVECIFTVDSCKIATLLRGGMIPMAYVYPSDMRATRDLLRRRTHLVRKRAELLAHIQNTNHQYNLPVTGKLAYKSKRKGVAERFQDVSVQKNLELDLSMLDHYDKILLPLEQDLSIIAKLHDADSYFRLRSIPGSGGFSVSPSYMRSTI